MSEVQEILTLTVDDSAATTGLKKIEAGLNSVADTADATARAVNDFGKSTDEAGTTSEKTVPRLKEVDRAYEAMLKRIPGTTEALQRFSQIQAPASADMASGRIGEAAYNTILEQASAKYVSGAEASAKAVAAQTSALGAYKNATDGEARSLTTFHSATTTATAGTGNWKAAIGQAGFQLQDFFTQVSMGGNVLQAATVQGAQLAGIFGPTGP